MVYQTGRPVMPFCSTTALKIMSDEPISQLVERHSRKKPPNDGTGKARPHFALRRLVAPSLPSFRNTLKLAFWVEVKLMNDRDKPIAKERAILYLADGTSIELKTDDNGTVRFDNLPMFLDQNYPAEDVLTPAVQFPDILEEWSMPFGDYLKRSYSSVEHERHADGMVRFIPVNTAASPVWINVMAEDQKFQHFRDAYTANKAVYTPAKPAHYVHPVWNWGKGAFCNQHVNFFLGYWFNYNKQFTDRGRTGDMLDLTMNDSQDSGHKGFPGYTDFLSPIAGFQGTTSQWKHQTVHYIRMARYFDWDGDPTADGINLLNSLGDINVYSLSDITWSAGQAVKRTAAAQDIRTWLRHLPEDHVRRGGLTNDQIKHLLDVNVWQVAWDADEDDADDAGLLHTLYQHGYLNTDHHAGIIYRPAAAATATTAPATASNPNAGGAQPAATPPPYLTFSADGYKKPSGSYTEGPIVPRELKGLISSRHDSFLHLAIWSTKALRPGGYPPTSVTGTIVDLEQPPRPIVWVK